MPSHVNTRPSTISPSTEGMKSRLEMRLLHHYTTLTCKALLSPDADPGSREIFMSYIPQMSFDNEPLLKVLLSIGAAHMAYLTPNDEHLQQISLRYFSDAISEYRSKISEPGAFDANPEVLLGTTVLICFRGCISAHQHSNSVESFYQDLLLWLNVSQGLTTVQKTIQPRMEGTHLRALLDANHKSRILVAALMQHLQSQGCRQFQNLLPSAESEDGADPETVAAYTLTLQLLEWVHNAIVSGESQNEIVGRLNVVPFCLPPRFVQLLKGRQPRAVAIIAQYVALSSFVTDRWFLPQNAQAKVQMLTTLVSPEWLPLFERPLYISSLNSLLYS